MSLFSKVTVKLSFVRSFLIPQFPYLIQQLICGVLDSQEVIFIPELMYKMYVQDVFYIWQRIAIWKPYLVWFENYGND